MAQERVQNLFGPRPLLPNRWDVVAFALVTGVFVLLAIGARDTTLPLAALPNPAVSLDPRHLPEYALRTVLRMLAAIVLATLFTFLYAPLAAKSRHARLILIPVLDVLQSVPILGFLTFTVLFFLGLFPGQVLGAELAAVFAIFTSQAWNMTFSMYQSLRTVPKDLEEAAASFKLSQWQRFWRLDVPFAMPGLVWNAMMSMSGGWFFVVASEAITVGDTSVALPGIGTYVARAIEARDLPAIGFAMLTMVIVILIYDQLLFRVLVAWADKFRFEQSVSSEPPSSWVYNLFRRTRLLRALVAPLARGLGTIAAWRFSLPLPAIPRTAGNGRQRLLDALFFVAIAALSGLALWRIISFLGATIGLSDVRHAVTLGFATLARVIVLMIAASLIWVPVGVWIGLRPRLAEIAQPLAQFLAAFPANIAFPVAVIAIVRFDLDANVWLSPLMILGTQWYILFNVIAGASAFPSDLREAAASFHVRGWNWWRKVILPGILPYYVTGAVTACGGSWNAAIVAEIASWGDTRLVAFGLGSYIAEASAAGDIARVVLGVTVMALFVIACNRLVWHPLYAFCERRLRLA